MLKLKQGRLLEYAALAEKDGIYSTEALMPEIQTIHRHILETERRHPHATGAFTGLLQHIALAAKVVAAEVRRAGLKDVLGATGESNVQGEEVQKLDTLAHETLKKLMTESGYLAAMASEEIKDVIIVPKESRGAYVVNFDPLDGSSNIDANVSIGTIFSILPCRTSENREPTKEDCMQSGRNQLASGYVLYGSSTMFVYTTGAGVQGFTYEPTIGEFLLSHPDIRTPDYGTIYSVNMGNQRYWSEGVKRYIDDLHEKNTERQTPYSCRYIGSLISDFHRNLLYGGIFLYPADTKKDPDNPKPKLRLLYEANPLAFIVEQAGGAACSDKEDILDIIPTDLHQRVPLFIGSRKNIEELKWYIKKYDK